VNQDIHRTMIYESQRNQNSQQINEEGEERLKQFQIKKNFLC